MKGIKNIDKNKHWEVLAVNSSANDSASFDTEKIADILLENRGITTLSDKNEFLDPTPPEMIKLKSLGIVLDQIKKASARIKVAHKKGEQMVVFGDYDADGICGAAVLWETLFALGLNALPYIPERFSEGYGLKQESIHLLKQKYPQLKLIITVDNGIVADKAVEYANAQGIDIIITDHHQPGEKLPDSFATIHTTKISGSAVAWYFSLHLLKAFEKDEKLATQALDLVAIGTIADQLPLVGANRSLVKYGLEQLNLTKRPGLLELFTQSGIKSDQIGTYEVGFLIAPRINAMGRLEHALESLRLLCTKSPSRAMQLAQKINQINAERQKIVEQVVIEAKQATLSQDSGGVIIVGSQSYHEGVIGLAAARLVEEYYRPAIVYSIKGDICKASARSISGFNIIETIRKADEFLIEGGGHPMAAGFSIKTDQVSFFTEKLNKVSQALLTQELLTKRIKVDMQLEFENLDQQLIILINKFEPSGPGNPTPVFTTKDVAVTDTKKVGKEGNHLKLHLKKDNLSFEAIAFNLGGMFSDISPRHLIDIVYSLEENTWNGRTKLQLKIKDLKVGKIVKQKTPIW